MYLPQGLVVAVARRRTYGWGRGGGRGSSSSEEESLKLWTRKRVYSRTQVVRQTP